MSRRSPFLITLSDAERAVLEERAGGYSSPHAEVVRAKVVLLAAQGELNTAIAERLDVHVDAVSMWRKRYCEQGLAGLADRKRSGRPRTFPASVVAEVKAMACEPPERRGAPLSRWSSTELATQAVVEGLVDSVAASTVRRWLAQDSIKPWRFQSWIFPRDPNFGAKAARVLDLYARVWDGVELGPDDYVISADERSRSCRPFLVATPSWPPRPGVSAGWSSSTSGTARWPTSAPTTSTAPT